MTNPEATVLVVEDEDSFVEALTVGLRREGFRVQVAQDGAEALDVFDAVRPDLVLLDVMLPKVSGVDVCRELRRKSSVPIIMVTAKGSEIDTVVGLEVGADDYVTKPYRLRELVARMRAVLRRRPPEASARTATGEALEGDRDRVTAPVRRPTCTAPSSASTMCCAGRPTGCGCSARSVSTGRARPPTGLRKHCKQEHGRRPDPACIADRTGHWLPAG